jgi:hypothetical protein
LAFATFSKHLLAISKLRFFSAFWWGDTTIITLTLKLKVRSFLQTYISYQENTELSIGRVENQEEEPESGTMTLKRM